MRIIVYIETWNNVNKENFKEQLKLYNSMGETVCIDNSCEFEETDLFLQMLEDEELDNCSYGINDEREFVGDSINPYLDINDILLVSNKVMISKESVLSMQKVSGSAEHHAFVVPRTDKGDLQIFPGPDDIVKADDRMEWLKNNMPECSKMPCAFGECVFIKGKSISQITYFSHEGQKLKGLYNEFASFSVCLLACSVKLQDYAMNAVCANHAYSVGSNSVFENLIGEEVDYFKKEILEMYKACVERYNVFDKLPVETFGKMLSADKKKICFYLNNLIALYNGTSIHALCVLDGLIKAADCNEWETVLWGNPEILSFFGVDKKYDCKILTTEEIKETFDIGFVPSHMLRPEDQSVIGACCHKLVFWPLDLIVLRSNYLSKTQIIRNMEYIARFSDALMFLTENVKNDYLAYFGNVKNVNNIPCRVSYICPKEAPKIETDEELPFDSYYLVMGNIFVHKMIIPTVFSIMDYPDNFVVFSNNIEDKIDSKNIKVFSSGSVSDEYMYKLQKNCKGLIFPSIYEGFGLPPVEAMNLGKNVFVMDIPINHELESLAPEFSELIHYINSAEELPELLAEMNISDEEGKKYEEKPAYGRKWTDVGKDCIELFEEVLKQPMDNEKIQMRKYFAQR